MGYSSVDKAEYHQETVYQPNIRKYMHSSNNWTIQSQPATTKKVAVRTMNRLKCMATNLPDHLNKILKFKAVQIWPKSFQRPNFHWIISQDKSLSRHPLIQQWLTSPNKWIDFSFFFICSFDCEIQ